MNVGTTRPRAADADAEDGLAVSLSRLHADHRAKGPDRCQRHGNEVGQRGIDPVPPSLHEVPHFMAKQNSHHRPGIHQPVDNRRPPGLWDPPGIGEEPKTGPRRRPCSQQVMKRGAPAARRGGHAGAAADNRSQIPGSRRSRSPAAIQTAGEGVRGQFVGIHRAFLGNHRVRDSPENGVGNALPHQFYLFMGYRQATSRARKP